MPPIVKYKVTPQVLNDFVVTMDAKPNLTKGEVFRKFPELKNDEKFLQAMSDWRATVKTGKYNNNVPGLLAKFPEFEVEGLSRPIPMKPLDQPPPQFEMGIPVATGPDKTLGTQPDLELNPLFTAGKKIASTLWNQMLPSMSVGLQVALHEGLKGVEFLADETVGRIPGMKQLEEAVPTPKISDLQKKYLLEDAVGYAEERRTVDQEWTKDLVNNWNQVSDVPTAINWGVGALAQMAPQVLGAVATGGGSAMGQEVGSIYLDNLEQTAKENNLTVEQVMEKDMDEGAIALMIGVPLGMIETIGAKGVTGKWTSEAVKKFMNSPAGKVFRKRMVKYALGTGGATVLEGTTEYIQTGGEQAGKVLRSNRSLEQNITAVEGELGRPESKQERMEALRQGAFGGGGLHGIIHAGGDNKIGVPKRDPGTFSLNILVPDSKKVGPNEQPMTRVVQADASKLANPVEQPAVPSIAKDAKGNVITVQKQLIDTGLVDERTGETQYIERTIDSSGITQEFSFNGKPLKADNVQEASAAVLAMAAADRKVVYPVTGKLNIQQAAQNQDGTVTYATGLNDANTKHPVLITYNPNATGAQYSAYDGGVVGNSVEEVANKIQEIGTPKVTVAQGRRANEILAEEGVSKDTLYRIYKDVFGYSKEQAENQAKSMMNKIDKQIRETKANTTPTDLQKEQGSKQKPLEMTPEEVFAEMAMKEHGKKMQPLIDAFKKAVGTPPPGTGKGAPAPAPAGGAGKLGITPTPVAVATVAGKPTATSITGDRIKSPEKAVYAKGRKTKAAVHYDNVADFVEDMGWGDSAYKELFDYLKDKGVKMEFRFGEGQSKGNNKISVGHYDVGANKIVVYNNTPLRTLGHEAMHAILYTSGAWNNAEFRKSMDDIRDSIKKAVRTPGFAEKHMKGMTSAQISHYVDYTTKSGSTQEIVTHALTHPEYANFLANIPASKNAKPGDTAWGRLKQIVLDYLGKTLNLDNTALDELNAVLDQYVGINVKAKPTIESKPEVTRKPTAAEIEKVRQLAKDAIEAIDEPNFAEVEGKFIDYYKSIGMTKAEATAIFTEEYKKIDDGDREGEGEGDARKGTNPLTKKDTDAIRHWAKQLANSTDAEERHQLMTNIFDYMKDHGLREADVTKLVNAEIKAANDKAKAEGKKEEPKKEAARITADDVRRNAAVAGIDSDALKAIAKKVLGGKDLADMSQAELAVMLDEIENYKKPSKSKGDAVQKRKTTKVPVQPAPTDRKAVGKGVPESGKAPDAGKEKAKAGQEIDSLPAVQRGAVKTAMGKKWNLNGVKKYGAKVHPIVEMKNKAGDLLYINQKGDVFNNLDAAMRKSLVEEKPTKKKKVTPVEKVTGDATKEQPAMKPATDRTKVEETPQVPEPQPVELPKPPPARKPADQPSEDSSSTADLVVELMKSGFEFLPKSMPKSELIDFIASLDEEGKPLGPKAYAIMDQMAKLGYIKDNGKKVDILFETSPGSIELGDPNVDYRATSRAAADAAKDAAKSTVQGQAQKDMMDSVRSFINDLPEGVKNDLGALVKEVASAFNVSVGVAKGLVNAAKSTPEMFVGFTVGGLVGDFAKAWAHGRTEALAGLKSGLALKIDKMASITPIDFINPLSYIRAAATVLSAGVGVIQAGVKMATGNLDSEFFAPRARKFADWVADRTKIGVTSQNLIIRNVNRIMQGFYRGLTYTGAEVRAQSQLRGKRQEGALVAQQWMDELYKLIGRDQEMLARVHAVLDPEAYAKTQYSDVTYASLNEAEKAVYSALRVNMDNLHNWSLKKGYINEETYLKFVNDQGEINYFGRAYQEFYDAQSLGEDVGAAANALRADFTIYQHRKDFKDIKGLNLERDPIYIAAQRMATALQNEAVTDYAESIYNNNKIPRFANHDAFVAAGEPSGFSRLGRHGKDGGVYGPLTGMYLPDYVVYDFKGFFLSSKLNGVYTAMKAYDRSWMRRKMKEILTVYNPSVNLGNQVSNYTFAMVNGVDTFNFNQGLEIAKQAIKEKNELYRAVLAEGLLGTGITTELAKRLPVRLEEQAKQQRKDEKSLVKPIARGLEKVQTRYGEIDDKAKISAYWVKTKVYGMSHDQAITEVSQGFQNYDSVGMYFDLSSKMPIIGNAFAKFAGDMMRIVGTSLTHRPLSTAAYLGFIYALSEMSFGDDEPEDELVKEIRQNRPFQPRIPVIGLPLSTKVFGKEVNFARLIAPFQTYDKGSNDSGIWSLIDYLPVRAYVASSGGRPSYLKFEDPLLGPLASILYDKDFRGVSISDPKKIMGTETSLSAKNWNRAEYYMRSFGFIPATADDIYHIHVSGEDYYGRKKTEIDRLISNVIRVEEFNTPEAKQSVMREINARSFEIQGIMKENNAMYWHFKKEIEKIAAKEGITEEQRAYQINKMADGFAEALGASGPRLRKATLELYEPLNYLKALQEKTPAEKKD